MPVILLTGIPSSGKTTRTNQLRSYFKTNRNKKVVVVSENDFTERLQINKNDLFNVSASEKMLRAQLKSETIRLMNRDDILILDSGNYIKGFRYQLYCDIKNSGTTQCVIHCDLPAEKAWEWNCEREEDERYTREIFDGLVMRYEAPDSRNRWDSPLVTVIPENDLPFEEIYSLLFDRKPPPPNQSVQGAPETPADFFPMMDKITQQIISVILSSQKLGLDGDVKVPGYEETVSLSSGTKVSSFQLARLRRQFMTYSRMNPPDDNSKIGSLFIHYLSTNLS